MSSFTLGLVALGALVLVAVLVRNLLLLRRQAPRQAQTPPTAADTLSASERIEPYLEPNVQAQLAMPVVAERRPGLDALIDVIATITLEQAISAESVLAVIPATRRAGGKPYDIEGRNLITQQWETPVAGQRYDCFQAGVQLANRSGPLNEIEYSEFVVKTQAFADALGGMVDFPDMREQVARARELDQFASAHDAQLSFTLRARNAPWSLGFLLQHAQQLGWVPGVVHGRMVLPAEQQGDSPLLVLNFETDAVHLDDPANSTIHKLLVSLDVPQVDRALEPFNKMCDLAQALAVRLDAMVVDDHGRALNAAALANIAADLQNLYDALDDRDLCAGSPQARRLFS